VVPIDDLGGHLITANRRKAVKKNRIAFPCQIEQTVVHLVGPQQRQPSPFLFLLAHGNPDVGVNRVGAGHTVAHIIGDRNISAGSCALCAAEIEKAFVGTQLLRSYNGYVYPHFGGSEENGVGDVVPSIADVGDFLSLEMFEFLLECHDVRKGLGRMKGVCQAVVDGHAGSRRKSLHGLLKGTPECNGVEHPSQDAGRILDGFLCTCMDVLPGEEDRVSPLLSEGRLEGATGSSRPLFKQDSQVFSSKAPVRAPFFDAVRQREERLDLLSRKILECQQRSSPKHASPSAWGEVYPPASLLARTCTTRAATSLRPGSSGGGDVGSGVCPLHRYSVRPLRRQPLRRQPLLRWLTPRWPLLRLPRLLR
jgi:hypothetical protein